MRNNGNRQLGILYIVSGTCSHAFPIVPECTCSRAGPISTFSLWLFSHLLPSHHHNNMYSTMLLECLGPLHMGSQVPLMLRLASPNMESKAPTSGASKNHSNMVDCHLSHILSLFKYPYSRDLRSESGLAFCLTSTPKECCRVGIHVILETPAMQSGQSQLPCSRRLGTA